LSAQPDPRSFDIGNPLLEGGPCQMSAVLMTHPETGVQALCVTVRTSSATVTCFLPREQAEAWHGVLGAKLAKMTTLILPAANGDSRLAPFRPGQPGSPS
jgi:hypothetical protein